MSVIVRDSPRLTFHTDLREVVAALDGVHRDYLWFVSDVEAHRLGDGPFPVEMRPDADGATHDRWITGDRLDEIANGCSLQVVWGVFSAFPRDAPFAGGSSHDRRLNLGIAAPDTPTLRSRSSLSIRHSPPSPRETQR